MALAVLPALAIQVYSAVEAYQQRTAQVHAEALRLAQFVSGELDHIIKSNRAVLLALSRLPAVRDKDGPACRAYLVDLATHYPAFLGFSVLDGTGRLLCTWVPSAEQGRDFSDREYFKAARDSGAFSVGPMVTTRVTAKRSLPLTLPLRTPDGGFDGVVLSAIDLDWLNDYFAAKPLPEGGIISVVDGSGTVLVRVPGRPGVVGSKIRDDLYPLLAADRPGTGEAASLEGLPVLYAFLPPSTTPHGLYIGVSIGKDPAMAEVRRAAVRNGLLLLLSLGLAIAAAAAGGRLFIRRPLARLAEAAEHWRTGDFAARAGLPDAGSEIGRLGAAFDAMAANLAARERERDQAIELRDAALQQQKLLADELRHRVKNTLATVHAMARQTLRGPGIDAGKLEAFEERVVALASVHDALTRDGWQGADLAAVVAGVVAPHCGVEAGRIRAHGPPLQLAPNQALGLAMALHELCTNAVKYGALKYSGGQVAVTWRVETGDPRHLHLEWRETGGPTVQPPDHSGFGSRLIEQVAVSNLRGRIDMDWQPQGLVCRIEAPLPAAEGRAGAA